MKKPTGNLETFFCNLHTHTQLSDGRLSEEKLIERAIKQLGPKGVLAITDHNAVSTHIKELTARYKDQITLVPGCEASVSHTLSTGRKLNLHLNLLFFDPEHPEWKELLNAMNGDRDAFLLESIRVLEEKTSFRMTLPQLKEKFKGCQQIGRKHLAVCLVEQGLYETPTQALDDCIGRMRKPFCYVDESLYFRSDPDMETVISVGKAARGLVVLNHPFFYNLKEEELHELVHSFVTLCRQKGVPFAMEIEYSPYSPEERNHLYDLKEKYPDLLVSCGSDYHGFGDDEIDKFPGEYYLKLREAYEAIYMEKM